jgi:iron complex transport system ATP-binding protein
MSSSLSLHALSVRLGGRDLLQSLDAAFAPGEVACILGANGAGKSTLLACLTGLRTPTAGEARLDGKPLLRIAASARARRIGFLPQTPEIAWPLHVESLVALGRIPYGSSGDSPLDRAAVARAMAATATEPLLGRRVDTLSGGERARVLIARALAGEPDWLLADEPFAGLDPGHQLDACVLFRRLAHEHGCGVLLTLHDLSLALRLADRVLVLAEGRIIADGPPQSALSPEVLRQAYGVEARLAVGEHGPMLEVIGRHAA